MAMEKSCKEAASLSDSAKMMDFFRQEVARRRSQAKQPEAYETLMVQIVEMWGAFMGNECESQCLKNLWLDAGLEGGIADPASMQPIQIWRNGGRRSSRCRACQSHSHSRSSCFSYMANGGGILLGSSEAWRKTRRSITRSSTITSGRTTPNSPITILTHLSASP